MRHVLRGAADQRHERGALLLVGERGLGVERPVGAVAIEEIGTSTA